LVEQRLFARAKTVASFRQSRGFFFAINSRKIAGCIQPSLLAALLCKSCKSASGREESTAQSTSILHLYFKPSFWGDDNEPRERKFRIQLKKVAHSIAGIDRIVDKSKRFVSPARALLRAL
jgi:hypothetical protein